MDTTNFTDNAIAALFTIIFMFVICEAHLRIRKAIKRHLKAKNKLIKAVKGK